MFGADLGYVTTCVRYKFCTMQASHFAAILESQDIQYGLLICIATGYFHARDSEREASPNAIDGSPLVSGHNVGYSLSA